MLKVTPTNLKEIKWSHIVMGSLIHWCISNSVCFPSHFVCGADCLFTRSAAELQSIRNQQVVWRKTVSEKTNAHTAITVRACDYVAEPLYTYSSLLQPPNSTFLTSQQASSYK